MADMKAIAQTISKSYAGNAQRGVDLIATREGALNIQDYILSKGIEGKVFTVSAGSASSPISFVAAASFALTLPMLGIDVPAGTLIIPIEIQVQVEATGGTIFECFAHTGTGLVGAGTSTALTIYSTHRGINAGSACTARGPYTGAGTAPAVPVEFWRGGQPGDLDALAVIPVFEWALAKGAPQIVQGAGSLAVYATAATSSTGFIRASWIEFRTGEI